MIFRKIIINFIVCVLVTQILGITVYASELEENNEMKIYSEAAILIDSKTGKVLYEKESNIQKYPASTTKILTAIIALEKCDLNENITASYDAVTCIESGYTKADIQPGETFTLEQLLDVLMLQSANEAANVIAEHISGSISEFSNLMNEKAKEIGCLNTNFVNANGCHDANHYSTAYDMALIMKYCMENEDFRKIIQKEECSLPLTEFWQEEQVREYGERTFKNTNSLLNPESRYYYPYCIGGKTGFTTPAKNCLISVANKDGFETIAVILHAETTEEGLSARYIDTINLFEYGYNNYDAESILDEYSNKENSLQTVAGIVDNDELKIEPVPEIVEKKEEVVVEKNNNYIVKITGIILLIIMLRQIFSRVYKKTEVVNNSETDIYKFNL